MNYARTEVWVWCKDGLDGGECRGGFYAADNAKQPWKRCLYCSKFDLWQGSLAVCNARRMVLSPKAHYNRRCNSWEPNAYCKAQSDWSLEPAATILAGNPEFL